MNFAELIITVAIIVSLSSCVGAQFHMYYTNPIFMDEAPSFSDCLYYTVLDNTVSTYTDNAQFKPTHQTIPYCVRTNVNAWNFKEKIVDAKILSFELLARERISIYDLFLWSASIDIIEYYQDYLTNKTNISALPKFHNCTSPWFGSFCQ